MVRTRTFQGLFLDQIRSLYSAETQLLRLLPRMTRAATLPALKQDFLNHIEDTKENLARLEELFHRLKDTPWGKHCSAMQGIVFECNGMTQANYCQSVRDAGLMAGAERIEHYETAAYGTARAFALLLQDRQSAVQLKRTLKEESTTLKLLL
ncbi:MAG: DUF892 family protein [Phycisphaerae bacterium]|nr:DUF892 family protein [Phycisphaerae bacterium]